MMSDDEWVKERAAWLIEMCCASPDTTDVVAAALWDAYERGKAEAVAAERERIAAMLRKPDPALRKAVAMAKHSQACDGGHSIVGGPAAEAAMFALARTLTEGKENTNDQR